MNALKYVEVCAACVESDLTGPRCVYPVLLDDAVLHATGRRLPGDADAGAVA